MFVEILFNIKCLEEGNSFNIYSTDIYIYDESNAEFL